MNWAKTIGQQDEKYLSVEFGAPYIKRFEGIHPA